MTNVSTHSRPKAAGLPLSSKKWQKMVSTHSRPKAAGFDVKTHHTNWLFQHTAARRRLAFKPVFNQAHQCFNTQPPEGGWLLLWLNP